MQEFLLASRNPDIDELGKNKYRLILMNKADLADKEKTKQWSSYFKKMGFFVVSLDARTKNSMKSITDIVMEACKEKNRKRQKTWYQKPSGKGNGCRNTKRRKVYIYKLICR